MERRNDVKPDAEGSTKFWRDIWSQDIKHNCRSEWMEHIEVRCRDVERQEDMTITIDDQMKRTPNWKSSGPDGVNGYWIENFDLTQQLDGCLETGEIPNWMTKSRTCLILKDKPKGNLASNFRPITCLFKM